MASLATGQYQIARADGTNSFTYGRGAGNVQVQSTQIDTGSATVQDQQVTGHDGTSFGIDTMAGSVITQTGVCKTTPATGVQAMDSYASLAAVWNDPVVRLADNAVQILRAMYPGSLVTRVAYGRGRKIAPSLGGVFQGLVPFTAQFQCADGNWYDDVPSSSAIRIGVPFGVTSGITFPVTTPVLLKPVPFSNTGTVTVSGPLPTWPVFTFGGPVINPKVTFVNTPVSIGYTGTIAAGQGLIVDTRPWARTFTIGTLQVDGTLTSAVSGAGSLSGSAMIAMQLQPGTTTLRYDGTDYVGSGASTLTVSWRNAWPMIGGSF